MLRAIAGIVLGLPFLALLVAMLFGPPVMLALETIDMIRQQRASPEASISWDVKINTAHSSVRGGPTPYS
jgi:hypothetical protein